MTRTNLLGTVLIASAAVALVALPAAPVSAAQIFLINFDDPGEGLNDPTPATPVGGNPGTTLGDQRQFAYLVGADLLAAAIDSSQPIFVAARFNPLSCSPTSGVLGSAGTTFVIRDFAGATAPATWHHSALADALSGVDQVPGFVDISSTFNSRIGTDPGCLTGRDWYYGFDHNGGTDFDFLNVVVHEIAHGLGFSNFINEGTGATLGGFHDVYSRQTLDVTTGKLWSDMTQAEIADSAINDGNVVWAGLEVTSQAPSVLGPRPSLKVQTPFGIKGSYEAQAASFGPALTGEGTPGLLVAADDGVGVGSDGCEPILTNLSDKIALIDRGTCTFTQKVANAQARGAKGVVIANSVAQGLPGMGGADPSVTIPSVGVTQALGATLRASHKPVVRLLLDDDFLAGAVDGMVRLYAPPVVAGGSSGSHWDVTASPNLLMEPFINPDLRAADTLDLTPAQFKDVGWVLLP